MNEIFNKFSPNLKKTLVDAEKIASERNSILNTDHELLSLLQNKETLAHEILTSFDITVDRIELIATLIGHKDEKERELISKDAKKSIQLAVQIAAKYNHLTIGSEHLLLALISNKNFNSYMIIERAGIDPKKIKKQVETIFNGINNSFNKSPEIPFSPIMNVEPENFNNEMFENVEFVNPGGPIPPFGQNVTKTAKKDSTLETFATNLTRLATEGKLDPVIGRENEITRMVQILLRRTKNNPIIVGETGVGKTSVVEGLAQRIYQGKVPTKLLNAEIFSLDLGSIIAGTMYRGQFETRVKKLLAEIEKKSDVILFVDEIHMMIGAGSTEGSIDAANLLKPMLAKGQLRLIGATTFDEYRKHIEKDPAFERRLQPIQISEPTIEETIKILQGIKDRYEKFHNVKYSNDAIRAAAELSKRYINDRFLPDKAVDLLDESGASATNKIHVNNRITALKKQAVKLQRKKEKAISDEKYDDAAKLKEEEIKLEQEIQAEKEKVTPPIKTIAFEDIASLVSSWTGVPVLSMTATEKKNYLNLDKRLKANIIGQDEAILELTKAIKRARVGISNPLRPIGSFMFLGPTGVGKTELAKVLSKEIFGSEKSLIKIDMSEFMEKHNVARLVGAPAGYVGYEEGGRLTETVRKNPYSIILFDEIEKAHPEVFNMLLQIMEDGTLTDAKGRKVDFRNTIIIMTSNLGTDILRKETSIGFNNKSDSKNQYEKLKTSVQETVEKSFRPEFINRLDKIIVFYPLGENEIRAIVDLELLKLEKRLLSKQLSLKADVQIRNFIAKNSYSKEFGARPIRKFITDHIEDQITDAILAEKFKPGNTIELELKKEKIVLK